MKRSLYIMSVGLMAFLTIGCYRDDRPKPLKFETYAGNPILSPCAAGEWDDANLFSAYVYQDSGYFRMYYCGTTFINRFGVSQIGFASSKDGITWNKYSGNPVYKRQEDPYIAGDTVRTTFECPWLVFRDTVCLMYYDYGTVKGEISMATAKLKGYR